MSGYSLFGVSHIRPSPLRHSPHSAARLRCAHLMAVAVFLRIMCAKATATIASYRLTSVPSITKLCKLLKFNTCRVFLFVKISKMVTFGHHSANR